MRLPIGAMAASAWMACLGAMLTPVVAAQDIEEIVVTGTRISRPDFVSPSPIVSIDQGRFETAASNTAEDVLNAMPQFVPSFGSASNNPANAGQANVALRGLPNTSTLVLVDGRRLIPANGNGVVDLNLIPPALIESVEVVTGGASAVYGSDAVAGVVNLKLKHDFHGVEFSAAGGVTDRGDGEQYDVGLTAGTKFAQGRGSLMGYVGYTDRALVTQADRSWSRYSLVYVGDGQGNLGPRAGYVAAGSSVLEEGLFVVRNLPQQAFQDLFAGYGFPDVPYQTALAVNGDGSLFTTGWNFEPPVDNAVANYRGIRDPKTFNDRLYGYNFATANALQLPLERTSAFLAGDFEFGPSADVYWQALYSDRTVSLQLAPTGLRRIPVPVTNPYIPADLATLLASRPVPTADFLFQRRMSELGPRVSDEKYSTYQVTLGSQGEIGAGWSYDVYLQSGETTIDEFQRQNALYSRVEELLYSPDGGAALCGGFNPFGIGGISPQCAQYVSADGVNHTKVEQRIAEAVFNGPLWALPAGDVQAAVGAMYKEDEFSYVADPIAQTGDIIGFNPSEAVDGKDHNFDVYAEVSVPLLRDQPGVRSLEAVLGVRFSDYASAGTVDAYKAELMYQPVEAVRLRGSYQHAVRAPSVYELYLPRIGPLVGIGVDPCNFDSEARNGADAAAVTQLCAAQGIPAADLPTFVYSDTAVDGATGGNPALQPEEADTYTVGFVITSQSSSRWLSGLQFSLDWYQIDVKDAIALVTVESAVERCYQREFNPTLALSNTYCSIFQRDPATGYIANALEIYRNLGVYRTSGIDFQASWKVDVGPGTAGLQALVAYVDSFERSAGPDVPPSDLVGTVDLFVGGTLPEWKWTVRSDYQWQGIDVGLEWRHIDSLRDPQYPSYVIPSYDYLSAFVAVQFDAAPFEGLSLNAGVENLTDEEPPIFPSYTQANTDTSQYDTLGRRYFVRLKYRF